MRPPTALYPLIPALAATPSASAFIRLDPPPAVAPTAIRWQHDDLQHTVTPPANLALTARLHEARPAIPLLTFGPAPINRLGPVASLVYHPTTAVPAATLFATLDQTAHPTSRTTSPLQGFSTMRSPLTAAVMP